jgi:single-strand DNA-binding protein
MNGATVFWLAPLDRLAKSSTGDLVRITGRVRQSSYEADGETRYTVDMIADGFAILAKASGKPADNEASE